MKNLFKSLLVVACVGAICAGIACMSACGGGKSGTGEAYDLTHGARFVGYSSITLKNGKITDVVLTEVDLPAEITAATATAETEDAAKAAALVGKSAEDYALKQTKENKNADGTTKDFTATYVYAKVSYNQVELTFNAEKKAYETKDGTAFTEWLLHNTERCKEYYDAAIASKVAVTLNGAKDMTKMNKAALSKEENGYWSGANYPLGWKGNRNAFVKYVKENGVDGLKTLKLNTDKVWVDDKGVSTGATWTDGATADPAKPATTYIAYATLMLNAYDAIK